MADRNGITMANKTISQVQGMIQQLKSTAENVKRMNLEIDGLVAGPTTKTILLDGLKGLEVSITELNTDRKQAVVIAQYIIDNLPIIL